MLTANQSQAKKPPVLRQPGVTVIVLQVVKDPVQHIVWETEKAHGSLDLVSVHSRAGQGFQKAAELIIYFEKRCFDNLLSDEK
jgi:hypothetical protein